jgi:hypothetical protein
MILLTIHINVFIFPPGADEKGGGGQCFFIESYSEKLGIPVLKFIWDEKSDIFTTGKPRLQSQAGKKYLTYESKNHEFSYSTRFSKKLYERFLRIELSEGKVKVAPLTVSILTIAAGPIKHTMMLFNADNPSEALGSLTFNILCEQFLNPIQLHVTNLRMVVNYDPDNRGSGFQLKREGDRVTTFKNMYVSVQFSNEIDYSKEKCEFDEKPESSWKKKLEIDVDHVSGKMNPFEKFYLEQKGMTLDMLLQSKHCKVIIQLKEKKSQWFGAKHSGAIMKCELDLRSVFQLGENHTEDGNAFTMDISGAGEGHPHHTGRVYGKIKFSSCPNKSDKKEDYNKKFDQYKLVGHSEFFQYLQYEKGLHFLGLDKEECIQDPQRSDFKKKIVNKCAEPKVPIKQSKRRESMVPDRRPSLAAPSSSSTYEPPAFKFLEYYEVSVINVPEDSALPESMETCYLHFGDSAVSVQSLSREVLCRWKLDHISPVVGKAGCFTFNIRTDVTDEFDSFTFCHPDPALIITHLNEVIKGSIKRRKSSAQGLVGDRLGHRSSPSGGGALFAPTSDDHIDVINGMWKVVRSNSVAGHNFFTNLITGLDSWSLPSEQLYSITLTDPVPLGLEFISSLEADKMFLHQVPHYRNVDSGAVIIDITTGGAAHQLGRAHGIAAGHQLVQVNNVSVRERGYHQTVDILKSLIGSRPLSLFFFNPFACSESTVKAVASSMKGPDSNYHDPYSGSTSPLARDGIAMLQRGFSNKSRAPRYSLLVPTLPPIIAAYVFHSILLFWVLAHFLLFTCSQFNSMQGPVPELPPALTSREHSSHSTSRSTEVVTCKKCSHPIPVHPSSQAIMCAGCGATFQINRRPSMAAPILPNKRDSL